MAEQDHMSDASVHDEIARLEAEIEALSETSERCRKIMLMSRVAIVAGGLLLLAILLGAVGFDPGVLIGAVAALIGGIVLLGSNSTTWKETEAAIKSCETARARLIGAMDLHLVADEEPRRVASGRIE